MQRIDIIERKLNTAKDLQSIVKTMKGLAAVSISQYEHAVDTITQYFSTIEQGLQIIMQQQPQLPSLFQQGNVNQEDQKRIAIVFGAGQPMCGAFNEVLATYFDSEWRKQFRDPPSKIVVVGHRVRANLERYGRPVDHLFEMPTTIERINDTVQSLVLAVQAWNAEDEHVEVLLFYNCPEPNANYKPQMEQLLPINLEWLRELSGRSWSGRSIPTYSMDASELVAALVKQLLFVSIYKAFSESLSAENNSRLVAMQLAERKITEMIDELTKAYWSRRQVNITEEILDIMASFEVLMGESEVKYK
jgi:F-type H+-transporting ATPase subunit gamma